MKGELHCHIPSMPVRDEQPKEKVLRGKGTGKISRAGEGDQNDAGKGGLLKLSLFIISAFLAGRGVEGGKGGRRKDCGENREANKELRKGRSRVPSQRLKVGETRLKGYCRGGKK